MGEGARGEAERANEAVHVAEKIALSVELHPGTRRFRVAQVRATFDDGKLLLLDVAARGASIAMQGLGYSGGYDDGRGLGAWRGVQDRKSVV